MPRLKAPFPWFGGKSRAAHIVWDRFGDVPNYVEPFAGSLAVLLGRPTPPRIETVNDLDCFVANFWRAVASDPEAVATFADWPINEADLHARHRWLVSQAEFMERMKSDPDYFDAKIAGWWVWGLCQWIGSGWCASTLSERLPKVGNGHNSPFAARTTEAITAWMLALQDRLRKTRVACGDWSRILGPSVTEKIGITGIMLDPPYGDVDRDPSIYTHDDMATAGAVREWALANGDNPMLRIALCGYEGEHDMPETWECVAWKAIGGYASAAGNDENAKRERIWFNASCLRPQGKLFT